MFGKKQSMGRQGGRVFRATAGLFAAAVLLPSLVSPTARAAEPVERSQGVTPWVLTIGGLVGAGAGILLRSGTF